MITSHEHSIIFTNHITYLFKTGYFRLNFNNIFWQCLWLFGSVEILINSHFKFFNRFDHTGGERLASHMKTHEWAFITPLSWRAKSILLLHLWKLLTDEENNLKYRVLAGAKVRLKPVSKFGRRLICICDYKYKCYFIMWNQSFREETYNLITNHKCSTTELWLWACTFL